MRPEVAPACRDVLCLAASGSYPSISVFLVRSEVVIMTLDRERFVRLPRLQNDEQFLRTAEFEFL